MRQKLLWPGCRGERTENTDVWCHCRQLLLDSSNSRIGWSGVRVICGHVTMSMLWGNTAYHMKSSGEDLSRYWNKIESVGFRKCSWCYVKKVMSQ